MSAGDKLRLLRLEQGMTMTELSRISGVSLQTICGLEHNRHKPSLPVYELLLEAMGYELVIRRVDDDTCSNE